MTIIAAIVEDGRAWMAADRVTGFESVLYQRGESKLRKQGEYLIGAAGVASMQMLTHSWRPPEGDDVTAHQLTCSLFEHLHADELSRAEQAARNNPSDTLDGVWLMASRRRIWIIDASCVVHALDDHFAAIGCAQMLALGSLHTTAQLEVDPTRRLSYALEAGAALDEHIRGPFDCMHLS